jgi:hypothetical protein
MQAGFAEIQLKSDVLSLHIPWTAQTNKMVDAILYTVLRRLLDFEPPEVKTSRFSRCYAIR